MLDKVLIGIGLIIFAIYFIRRMFWLTKGNYHNLTHKENEAADEIESAHDYKSWALLGAAALFLYLGYS